MKKVLIVNILCVFIACISFAQNKVQMNVDLGVRLNELKHQGATATPIMALVQGDVDLIERFCESNRGAFKFSAGDIASIELPAYALQALSLQPFVKRINGHRLHYSTFNEAMRENNNADSVKLGLGVFPIAYTGEDVIVGIIDSDIDPTHPDLKNADGTTRILSIWDQINNNGNPPMGYNYGSQWTKIQIDNGTSSYTCPYFHGTHVAGIAAGNGLATGKNEGMAPKSDIIYVQIPQDDRFMTAFTDAVNYIFQKAAALGKPCVINSSVGTYYGSHDGTDLYAKTIENILDASPGRMLVQAAGNARAYISHARLEPTSGTPKSVWFDRNATSGLFEFYMFADSAHFNHQTFNFDYIDGNTFASVGSTVSYNILNDFDLDVMPVDSLVDTLFTDANNQPVILKIYAAQEAGVYEVWYRIFSSPSPDKWQFNLAGNGFADIWSNPSVFGSSMMVSNPPISVAGYTAPDNKQTIVSSWACSDKVVTVGAYFNRDWFINVNGDTTHTSTSGNDRGILAAFSSRGPTRDGRIKPDLTTAGTPVLSCLPTNQAVSFININPSIVAEGGYHYANGGTSMAAPQVTGAAALYFQCQPDATYATIKQALLQTVRQDANTLSEGVLPNADWGYGKMNVTQMMYKCLVYGCTDPDAMNYNPNANVDDGSCLFVAVEEAKPDFDAQKGKLIAAPVPFDQECMVYYQFESDVLNPTMKLYDLNGRLLQTYSLPLSKGMQTIDGSSLPQGVYLVVLGAEGAKSNVLKIVKY